MGHCRYFEAVDDRQLPLRYRLEVLQSVEETTELELVASFCYDISNSYQITRTLTIEVEN
jgi:hypothetical protein